MKKESKNEYYAICCFYDKQEYLTEKEQRELQQGLDDFINFALELRQKEKKNQLKDKLKQVLSNQKTKGLHK